MRNWFISILTGLGLCSSAAAQDGTEMLAPEKFREAVLSDTTAVVLDVRQQSEYDGGHLENAILLDYLCTGSFMEGIKSLDPSKTYYVYCRSGRRSHAAADKMKKLGLKVFDMAGGFLAWTEAGLPVVKD